SNNARTEHFGRSSPSSTATSARRIAYVGVQPTTVTSFSIRNLTRAAVLIPPPARQRFPRRFAPSNPAQKPRKGPNENAKKSRSLGCSSIIAKSCSHEFKSFCQLWGVSSQRVGEPVVPEV